jgi:D-glycero-alpha-D-manno-heptose-7-phosphate kinase
MRFCARTPVRICFMGGGTDSPPFSIDFGGAIVNAAISRYVYVTIELRQKDISFNSKHYPMPAHPSDFTSSNDEFDLNLLKVCIKRFGIATGLRVSTDSTVPPGSGLGTSSALCVAMIAAIYHSKGLVIEPTEIANLAIDFERGDLALAGGIQDQYSAAFGGINYITTMGASVAIQQSAGAYSQDKSISPSTILELEKNTLLVYTGESHNSSDIHSGIHKNYQKQNLVNAMQELKHVAQTGWTSLLNGDILNFAKLMNESWNLRKQIYPLRTNELLDSIHKIAHRNGALGSETCGAGGGGCVVILCEDGSRQRIENLLLEKRLRVLHFTIDLRGVQVWSQ